MFNSPVLDLVILLSFTYFIGSLLLSTLNEAIAGTLRLRQKQLKISIENLFFEHSWKTFIKTRFSQSPPIQVLMKNKGRYPAYISSVSFVQAIISQLHTVENYTKENFLEELKANKNLPETFKQLLINLWMQSQQDLTVFEKKLAEFYDGAMDRASGWYKRKIRMLLLIIGFLLALALNMDTIQITTSALSDKQRLSKAVDNIAANLPKLDSLRSIVVTDSSIEISKASLEDKANTIKAATITFQSTSGYGLGYTDFAKEWKGNFWKKLIGLLITAFALQLGSNYWFDLMNKAVNIRSVGKKPEVKSDSQTATK